MIQLDFDEEPCHECGCCMLFQKALQEAGNNHSYRGKVGCEKRGGDVATEEQKSHLPASQEPREEVPEWVSQEHKELNPSCKMCNGTWESTDDENEEEQREGGK